VKPTNPSRALLAAILDADAPEALASQPRAWLIACGLTEADVDATLRHGAERLLVYRSLVHTRLADVVKQWAPLTCAHLGKERLAADVADFLASRRGVTTPYLRDVPREFVLASTGVWARDTSLPPWLGDLARFELLRLDVRNDPTPHVLARDEPPRLDAPIECNPTLRIERFDWTVDTIGSVTDVPEHAPVVVVAVRRGDHRTHQTRIDPLEVALLEALVAGQPLVAALRHAAASVELPFDDTVLVRAATFLQRLGALDVLVGPPRSA
jgi:hypothetical protein